MEIQENVPLAAYTTFHLGGPARFFARARTEADLLEAARFADERRVPLFVLGGGSNLLIADQGVAGLVLKMELTGVSYQLVGPDGFATVAAAAGVTWDDFVAETLTHGLYGLENLSAIPGTVGASAVQNIGAYGVEAGNLIVGVRALDRETMTMVELDHAACRFAYRDSLFKQHKGRYIISTVFYRLHSASAGTYVPHIGYKDLTEYFEPNPQEAVTATAVREAVTTVRRNKLPDWHEWGTAGSFFKNPTITAEHFATLVAKYPGLPGFPEPHDRIKVSLGWILDKVCDVRGFCLGHACVYEKQALVLVAKPGATAAEVVALSQELMKRVKEKTDIDIEGEVEWVN